MTLQEEQKLLADVAAYVKADPQNMNMLIRCAVEATITRATEIRRHAVDMEVVASMAMNARLFKGNERFLADKLESWAHMNALRWDDQIKTLRERAK